MADFWDTCSSVWCGRPGALIRVPGVGHDAIKETPGRASIVATTTGGYARAQHVRRARSWTIELDDEMPTRDLAGLAALLSDVEDSQGYAFVTPAMQLGNLMTPGDARCRSILGSAGWTPTGSVTVDGITVGGSCTGDGSSFTLGGDVPVLVGQPVTLAAWVCGDGARINAMVVNAAGQAVQMVSSSPATASAGGWVRLSVTLTPTSAASTRVRMGITGAYQVAGPTITWTPTVRPYSPGRGVRSVVLNGDEIVDRWSDEQDGAIIQTSFTAWEVGP